MDIHGIGPLHRRRRIGPALCILAMATGLAAATSFPTSGTVTAGRLNVRLHPGIRYAAVAQLQRDDIVEILSQKDDWLEIPLPADAPAWIAEAYLVDGKTNRDVQVRSGPGILHGEYGTLPKGTRVEPAPDGREGWRRIVAPPGFTAWVSARHVAIAQAEPTPAAPQPPQLGGAASPSPDAVAAPQPDDATAAADSTPENRVAAGELARQLPVIDAIAEEVSAEGFVVPLVANATLVTHALCAKVNDEFFPLCYVFSSRQNLKLWEGHRVRVAGSQHWIRGWQRPVVEIHKITPVR